MPTTAPLQLNVVNEYYWATAPNEPPHQLNLANYHIIETLHHLVDLIEPTTVSLSHRTWLSHLTNFI
jgi:hypothetical protein